MRSLNVRMFLVVVHSAIGLMVPAPSKYLPTPPPLELPVEFDDFVCPDEGCAVFDEAEEMEYERFGELVKDIFDPPIPEDDEQEAPEDMAFDIESVLQTKDEAKEWHELAKIGTMESHLLVELDYDRPKYIAPNDFVFVDEPNCHGCGMCSQIAAATFFPEPDKGKGRVYFQGGDAQVAIDEAIHACPRGAIHRVSFDQLRDLETHRSLNPVFPPPPENKDEYRSFDNRLRQERQKFFRPTTAYVDLDF